jgi:hypothetical protein
MRLRNRLKGQARQAMDGLFPSIFSVDLVLLTLFR